MRWKCIKTLENFEKHENYCLISLYGERLDFVQLHFVCDRQTPVKISELLQINSCEVGKIKMDYEICCSPHSSNTMEQTNAIWSSFFLNMLFITGVVLSPTHMHFSFSHFSIDIRRFVLFQSHSSKINQRTTMLLWIVFQIVWNPAHWLPKPRFHRSSIKKETETQTKSQCCKVTI